MKIHIFIVVSFLFQGFAIFHIKYFICLHISLIILSNSMRNFWFGFLCNCFIYIFNVIRDWKSRCKCLHPVTGVRWRGPVRSRRPAWAAGTRRPVHPPPPAPSPTTTSSTTRRRHSCSTLNNSQWWVLVSSTLLVSLLNKRNKNQTIIVSFCISLFIWRFVLQIGCGE